MAGINRERGAKGCFKFGCFGCLVLIALFFGIPALLALVGVVVGSPEPNYETVSNFQPLPEVELPPEESSGQSPSSVDGSPLEEGQLGGVQSPSEGASLGELEEGREANRLHLDTGISELMAGTIDLSLEMGEFTVEPGPPGDGIRLEGDYDEASFELSETYEMNADGSWTYGLELRNKRSWFSFFGENQQIHNKLRLILPRDRPMAVRGRIRAGESDVDLGGLFLTGVDLELKMGDHDLRFSEPTRVPMESLKVESSWGKSM